MSQLHYSEPVSPQASAHQIEVCLFRVDASSLSAHPENGSLAFFLLLRLLSLFFFKQCAEGSNSGRKSDAQRAFPRIQDVQKTHAPNPVRALPKFLVGRLGLRVIYLWFISSCFHPPHFAPMKQLFWASRLLLRTHPRQTRSHHESGHTDGERKGDGWWLWMIAVCFWALQVSLGWGWRGA